MGQQLLGPSLPGIASVLGHHCSDLLKRHKGHLQEESFDISVVDIHEVLKEGIGARACRREPYRSINRLAELLTIGPSDERNGEPVNVCPLGAANEVDSGCDVSPLI
jgi:hypothetical protein